MQNEWDRRLIPELFQNGFSVWLGAAYHGMELMTAPHRALPELARHMRQLSTIPEHSGPDPLSQARALAEVWIDKSIELTLTCHATGQKFTRQE